jgi:hypothetical protein
VSSKRWQNTSAPMWSRLTVISLFSGCFGSWFEPSAPPPEEELIRIVDQIRAAQIELLAVDDFIACGTEAEARAALQNTPRSWDGPSCWTRIGWAPEGKVHGGYWVEVSPDGEDFTVHGVAQAGSGILRASGTRHRAAALLKD